MRLLIPGFIVVLFLGLFGCEKCGIVSEPVLLVSFKNPVSIFQRVRVLESLKESLSQQDFSSSTAITAPINLNANSTTYVFERANRTDTLTVFYQQKVFNASNSCGYVLDLEAPNSGVQFKSSFKKVAIVYYPAAARYNNRDEGEFSMIITVSEL